MNGTGCIDPLAEGEDCTLHEMCQSGVCDPETQTCIQPAAMGEPCRYDVQCVRLNCTNDGDVSREGICGPQLGSGCTNGDDCTQCLDPDPFTGLGLCTRDFCDPETHPSCPPDWECVLSTDGLHRCYEVCDPSVNYLCRDPMATCDFNGYCD